MEGNASFNPSSPLKEGDEGYNPSPTLQDRVHVLVSVIPADGAVMLSDVMVKKMRKIRRAASDMGIPQLAIITKGDKACSTVKDNVENLYKSKYLKKKFNPSSPLKEGDEGYNPSPTLQDRVHVLVSVIPVDGAVLITDVMVKKMRKIRRAASDMGIPQLAIITKGDKACGKSLQEQIPEAKEFCCMDQLVLESPVSSTLLTLFYDVKSLAELSQMEIWLKAASPQRPPPPAHPEGSPGVPRPVERHSLSNVSWVSPGSPTGGTCPEHLTREASRGHPD
ncbi:hypothetical protein D4764_0167770 [Takifugu flavidus]|uniref:Interferon-induced protein 44 n=1 Tax=Takifugu flavidus TaxID=433684 RepID=A0A5C6MHF0_9TELE|nr:hypothetical protein D4764_0167770 [Takifugu flavidus]